MTNQVVYVVCGNAGVGKSTYGRRLAVRYGACLIDIDTVTERLAKLVLAGHGLDPDDRDSPEYKALLREPVYNTLFDVARENLPHVPCVIVGPFTRERREAKWLNQLETQLQTTVEVHYVYCSEQVRRERIIQRRNPRDAGKLERWEEYAQQGRDPASLPFRAVYVCTDE